MSPILKSNPIPACASDAQGPQNGGRVPLDSGTPTLCRREEGRRFLPARGRHPREAIPEEARSLVGSRVPDHGQYS